MNKSKYTFQVWNGDDMIAEFWDAAEAVKQRQTEREWCAVNGCGNGDAESFRSADGTECGTSENEPHAVTICVIDEDGNDVTGSVYDSEILRALA